VPQTSPDDQADPTHPVLSPVYEMLETNIPRGLMGFSDQDWDADCQLFPGHETVLKYLEHYAVDVLDLIKSNTKVLDIRPTEDERWLVKTIASTESARSSPNSETFDAVLIASGHFDVPHIPSVSGIEAWNKTHPGSITHSKFYRHPSDFVDKKVIVVGNSASGVDIAAQISSVSKMPLVQSSKSPSAAQSETKLEKPQITEYIVAGRCVQFADGSVERDVDSILYCTGYFYSYPFLRTLRPSVVTSGEYVENLYQHIFYRPCPTLAFAALNQVHSGAEQI